MDIQTLGIVLAVLGLLATIAFGIKKAIQVKQSQKNTRDSKQSVNIGDKK